MKEHLSSCFVKIVKTANNALLDNNSDAINRFPLILSTLNYLYTKCLKYSTKKQEEVFKGTIELLRTILIKYIKDSKHKLIIQEDASIIHKIESFLLALIGNAMVQRRAGLEIAQIWIQLAQYNNGQRALHMIDLIGECTLNLIKQKNKKTYEYECAPIIQLIQDGYLIGKRIYFTNYLILRTIQASIVSKYSLLITKLLKRQDLEIAKQELSEASKTVSTVLGKMLQRALDEITISKAEKSFICQSFVEDSLEGLYDLSLPIASWVYRVLVMTLIKLIESEKKNVQFRVFLAMLLVKCYLCIIHDSNSNHNDTMKACLCNGTLEDTKGYVLRCTSCDSLFHNSCVGVNDKEAERSDYIYCCKNCLVRKKTISESVQCITETKSITTKKCTSDNKQLIMKDMVIGYYDSKIGEDSEDMNEAKIFSILKWVLHCNDDKEVIGLYKQYLLSERIIESEIIKDSYASKCYRKLIDREEIINLKLKMKNAIFNLLADTSYRIRIKALRCVKEIILREFTEDNIKEQGVKESLIALTKDEHAKIRVIALEITISFIKRYANKDEELWMVVEDRVLDKSPLVRKEAIEGVIEALDFASSECRRRVITLLVILAADNKRKANAERVVQGLHELWVKDLKSNKRPLSLIKDLIRIIKERKVNLETIRNVTLKVFKSKAETMKEVLRLAVDTLIQKLKNEEDKSYIAEAIAICSYTIPEYIETHSFLLSCFLIPEISTDEDIRTNKAICISISNSAHYANPQSFSSYKKIQVQLMQLSCISPLSSLEHIIQALSTIIQKITFEELLVASILEKAIILLQVQVLKLEKKKLPSIYRSLALIGYLCYYFDFEKLKTLKFQSESEESFSCQLFNLYKELYASLKDHEYGQDRVLESISYIWMRYNYLLAKSEDMLIDALNRNKEPEAIMQTLKMIHKLFQGNTSSTTEGIENEMSESHMALLIPKLFDKLEKYSRSKTDEIRYWSFNVIKVLADKGLTNHSKVFLIIHIAY